MSAAPRTVTSSADLARIGLGADAVGELTALGLWDDDGPTGGAAPVIRALADSANPERAMISMRRLAQERPDAWEGLLAATPEEYRRAVDAPIARFATVAGASSALAELFVTNPEPLDVLLGELERRDVDTVRRRCLEVMDGADDPPHELAILHRRALLRIATRDLMGVADTPVATEELADLAEGVLSAAHAHVADGSDYRLTVIGMGKLGGRELNYVSDVDIMFVGEGDLRGATHAAERLMRLVGGTTPAGRVYELDCNLRPEGRNGPLVRSVESFVAYWERWAKTWEFQALLKARPVAGDVDLGTEWQEAAQRFVWPDRLGGEAVAEIRTMKGRVEGSRPVLRDGGRQVKLAPGGIRDIEFAVQLLQLVHGRHDPSLRDPGTLPALAALAAGGYVDDGDANLFADAYTFLRTVEHRLQLVRLRRTHTIPKETADRARLARACGFRELAKTTALEQFDAELNRVRSGVRRLHEKLFYRPLLARFSEVTADDQRTVAAAALGDTAAAERLAALGFLDTRKALENLAAMADGVSRRARLFRTLLPALLPTLAEAPDPDGGLAALRSLADRLGDAPAFLRALRDTPPVAELVTRVVGARPHIAEWLVRQPDALARFVDAEDLARRIEPEEHRRMAMGLVKRGTGAERGADALRRMKRRELSRTAVRDLAGLAEVSDVGAELTGLAEACLEAAVAWTVPDGIRMAIIGQGKLGGRELGYASDLDVQVVFDPPDAREEALEAAKALFKLLSDVTPEGQAFHVDANLRPEGKQGPLARSLESVAAYYDRWAETWELQALTQARPVAGDPELGQAFLDAVAPHVYPVEVEQQRIVDVRQMKARVERERAERPTGGRKLASRAARPGQRVIGAGRPAEVSTRVAGPRVDLKLGPGGLSDVEWTVQILQMAHGGRIPDLRVPGAITALEAIEEAGVLEGRDVAWLREGHRLMTRLRNAQALGGVREPDRLPLNIIERERLGAVVGLGGAQGLDEHLGRTMRRVRKVHERAFYDEQILQHRPEADQGS